MAVDWDGLLIGPTVACFGVPVTYQPQAGASFPITAIFDQAYKELRPVSSGDGPFSDMLLGSVVTTETPMLGVRLSEFPQPPTQGDLAVVGAKRFVVREVRPDSHGGARLMLNQVDPARC